ncbi:hypothetical protein ACJJIQ_00110 (plasmid) [Microbulbifer sp. ANSA003]|uniref:hypothetical protein n=1 Tax=Microbulbifer sp. ANSA003 TaxID=3243360 RepID=UPI004043266D
MKRRQFKKLCKKARVLLIALGEPAGDFSKRNTFIGRHGFAYAWGINNGPEWYDAWFVLSQLIADETATWSEYETNPYPTSIGIFRYAQKLVEERQ